MLKKNVTIVGRAPEQNIWVQILISWFPTMIFIGFLFWYLRQMQGGGSGSGRGLNAIWAQSSKNVNW